MLSSKKDSRGYRLILKDEKNNKSYLCYEASKIEEIDYFTSHFYNLKDIVKHFNLDNIKNSMISCAYIERVGGKSKKYVILYRGNLFDYDKVIWEYQNYLLCHPDYFYKRSPVYNINLCNEDYSSYEEYVKRCCYVYFSKRNYREVRGAFVELMNLGLAKRVIVSDTDIDNELDRKQYVYKDIEDLYSMLNCENGPDWDEIYSQFDLEDIISLKKKGHGSGRGHR